MQSFTARMLLLTVTRAFGLGRRHWSSPQQCYLHYFVQQKYRTQKNYARTGGEIIQEEIKTCQGSKIPDTLRVFNTGNPKLSNLA